MDERVLRKAFGDIINGYSVAPKFIIKHFNVFDQINIDEVYQTNFDRAKKRGLLTEQETLAIAIKNKDWTEEDERTIKISENTLLSIEDSIKNAVVPSQMDRLREQLESEKKTLRTFKDKKHSLLGITCESFANKRTNDYYIFLSLYRDKELKQQLYNREDFEYLTDKELAADIKIYNQIMEPCSDIGIKRIAASSFFQTMFSLTSDVYNFYGKKIIELTFAQTELAMYGRYFKSIFEDNPHLPDRIKNDPDRIIDFVRVKHNAQKLLEKNPSGAVGLPGATYQDIKDLGLEHQMDQTSEVLKKSGKKSLSMSELMNLQK